MYIKKKNIIMNDIEYLKKKKKDRLWLSLDEDVFKRFTKHIEEQNLNKSKFIQYLIEKYLEKINKK